MNIPFPVLSIVMPVFNNAAYVKTMMKSIIDNTFADWELLAIDDGSSDEEYNEIQEFAAQDSRINYIRRNRFPKGAQTCRNMGLEAAKGEYICFFDSDDYITPACLGQRVMALTERKDLDFMVFRSGLYINNRFEAKAPRNIYGYKIYEDDVKAFCSRTLPFIVWNNIYRTKSLRASGVIWDVKLRSLQDAQFNIETILAGMKYDYSTQPADYGYRIESESSVSKKIMSDSHLESNLYATESFYSKIQNVYGHKYDSALFRGMMFVHTKVSRVYGKSDFFMRMASVIRKHSPLMGIIYTLQVYLMIIFRKILPSQPARQIPFFCYLYSYREYETKWLPSRLAAFMTLVVFVWVSMLSCAQSVSSRNDDYQLLWHDEFNGKSLDERYWTKIKRQSPKSFCHLTDDARFYKFGHGRLRLYARCNNDYIKGDTARYLTAGITSIGKGNFEYGMVMVRARIHGAVGTWPAIWTMPDDKKLWDAKSNRYAEIDLLEYVDRNDFVYQTAHNPWTLKSQDNWYDPVQQNKSPIEVGKYNIYSVEILPDELIFGINDVEMFRYPRREDVPDQYHYGVLSHLMINMQVNPPKSWSSGVKDSSFPAYMDVDWVRIYKLKQ